MYSAPHPALSTDAQQAVDDHDSAEAGTGGFTLLVNDCSAYRGLFYAWPAISGAMDYATHTFNQRIAIWEAIDAIETSPHEADPVRPADYPADPFDPPPPDAGFDDRIAVYTQAEARNSYAAKVAHCLYHEIHATFPWSIAKCSEDQMRGLLDVERLFEAGTWDPVEVDAAKQDLVLDHSPQEAYAIASANYTPADTIDTAIGNLITNVGKTFRHSTTLDPLWITSVEDSMQYDTYWGGATGYRVSRGGCPANTRFMAALARSINIPSDQFEGYYAGTGHDSVAFRHPSSPTGGLVLNHGDHMHNGNFIQYTGGRDICEPYNAYATDVFSQTPYPPYSWDADYASIRKSHIKTQDRILAQSGLAFENSPDLNHFDNPEDWGWWYIQANGGSSGVYAMGRYFTPLELDVYYQDLAHLTGGDGLPTKPSATNTGTSGDVSTPYAGPNPIIATTTVQDVTITGPLTCDASVTFINCLIDGDDTDVGVIVSAGEDVTFRDCEFINCNPAAIDGMPNWVYRCHIHEGHQHGINATGTGITGAVGPIDVRVEKCFFEKLGRTTAGYGVFTTSTTTHDVRCRFNTFYLPTTGQTGNASPYKCTAVVRSEGLIENVYFHHNWADGGVNVISSATVVSTVEVSNNWFGRSHETSGPPTDLNNNTGTQTWYLNTYEDDGSLAGQGD